MRSIAVILGFCLLACGGLARPALAAGCQPPSFLPQPPPGLSLGNCTLRGWGAMDISLPDGDKRIFGPWGQYTYQRAEGAAHLNEAPIREAMVRAVTAAGGRLLSKPESHSDLVLSFGATGAETYVLYHAAGPDDDVNALYLSTITVAPLPREAEAKPLAAALPIGGACADPAWLVKNLAAFKRGGCQSWSWAEYSIATADGSDRLVQGPKLVVSYTLTDDSKVPTSIQLQRNFLEAFRAMGATIVSRETDDGTVAAMLAGSAGETWYIYEAGGGNSDGRDAFSLTTMVAQPLPQDVEAKAMTAPLATAGACADPPWLTHNVSGFHRTGCHGDAWASDTLGQLIGPDQLLEGRRLVVDYAVDKDDAAPVDEAMRRQFTAAFKAMGATLMSAETQRGQVAASGTGPGGETWYVYQGGSGSSEGRSTFSLVTWELVPFKQEVEAKALAAVPEVGGPCADPPWQLRGIAAYKRQSCDGRDWIAMEFGDHHVEGRRVSTTYAAVDSGSAPPSILPQRNYLNALKAIGATIDTDERDHGKVWAHQTTPAGDTWYLYDAGSGNEGSRGSYTLTTLVAAPFQREVEVKALAAEGIGAPPAKSCTDPAWLVKQFAAYKLDRCDYQDMAPLEVTLPGGQKKQLAGRVLTDSFTLADQPHIRPPSVIWRNYVEALQALGATLVTDPKDPSLAVLTQKSGATDLWYIYKNGGGNAEGSGSYSLVTLQAGGAPPKACKLEIYGVNFDFDKSALRPESEPVLDQVLALFTADPAFAGEIGGHTDNIGKPPYNLKLSDSRAASVKTWLTQHGVAPTRVTSHGYGDTQPLVPNTTDENRFKNRRVELKRQNCK